MSGANRDGGPGEPSQPRNNNLLRTTDEDSASSNSVLRDVSSSDDEDTGTAPFGTALADPDAIMGAEMEFHRIKLKHLRQHYCDAYLEFFNNMTTGIQGDGSDFDRVEGELSTSQIGCVAWTSNEKAKFFDAMSRYGKYDLYRISQSVHTKSQVEVKALIDLLQEAFVDRQMYERETKNVSHAEIPAAIEISSDLGLMLEEAADALQVFQEGYDLAEGQQRYGSRWVVTKELAEILDDESETKSIQIHETNEHGGILDEAYNIFHLGHWLDCSEKCFMNWSAESGFDHWSTFAEPGQRPSITMDVVVELRNLTTSITQRILQVALFMAKQRIRASTNKIRRPAKVLTQGDVHAALDVLRMKHDSWEYWARLPRRNKLQVYSDPHRRGNQGHTYLDVAAAERTLLHMSSTRMSKSRSRSRGRSLSVETAPMTEEELSEEGQAEALEQGLSDNQIDEPCDEDDGEDDNDNDDDDDDGDDGEDDDDVNEASADTSEETQVISMKTRRKRKMLALEEAQDEYAERFDRLSKIRQEQDLWKMLNKPAPAMLKEEDSDDLGIRPKTLRKTKAELHQCLSVYESEWESRLRRGAGQDTA